MKRNNLLLSATATAALALAAACSKSNNNGPCQPGDEESKICTYQRRAVEADEEETVASLDALKKFAEAEDFPWPEFTLDEKASPEFKQAAAGGDFKGQKCQGLDETQDSSQAKLCTMVGHVMKMHDEVEKAGTVGYEQKTKERKIEPRKFCVDHNNDWERIAAALDALSAAQVYGYSVLLPEITKRDFLANKTNPPLNNDLLEAIDEDTWDLCEKYLKNDVAYNLGRKSRNDQEGRDTETTGACTHYQDVLNSSFRRLKRLKDSNPQDQAGKDRLQKRTDTFAGYLLEVGKLCGPK